MVQLVYASAAVERLLPDALQLLLAQSRSRNVKDDVTGMLLYHNGSFMQVLEGPASSVNPIFASIERDKRHTGIKTLLRHEIQRREFAAWSMAFVDFSMPFHQANGFVDYYTSLPMLSQQGSRSMQLLRFFQDGLCRELVAQ